MDKIVLTRLQAKRFLLLYHGLNRDSEFIGKEGILSYIRRVGCIQFDPLNVVGMNPELVLQSRITDFDRNMLWELLYQERKLIDYWDKNMSIFPLEDWPYFSRRRSYHSTWCNSNKDTVDRIYAEIENRGYLCSGDLDYGEKVNWSWGPAKLSRAALEGMYHAGRLVIHHKVNTRKYYDLTERLIPTDLYSLPDPFETDEQYYEWYVLRRIGSVGLLWNRPSDAWLGISGMRSPQRNAAFAKLTEEKKVTEIDVEGLQHPLYIRSTDLDVLNEALSYDSPMLRSSILAPLDNLLWDRTLIKELFDFEYRWEVYKPAAERKYGYYVLPVVYGDNIVARFEPVKHNKNAPLAIKNWWWEDHTSVNSDMKESVLKCLERFAAFLGTDFPRTSFEL
ncbi:winged helix-turn-helix domain-containing protein [Cohnella cholangitidis]|uniref:Winged helix-turn-helix domain-containing protein n=1 Tax=Cohnella cholangitidis TaxID=2598458 RepID=A0A7G5C0A5_9BACL|nr:crosslink repair DNA glycosylase YcaQ family protein [Cohnella cholangitidis]QMV42639.1 winged helix-turn-helix domain-containing protein [Cohnella cholangitidis]